ncbi:hypothetical protein HKX17_15700 [Sulfitobacter sp. KE34]|uniref:hypothetical protein n=1 Tax=unclassified Sulfitobacter TaxID=196795 RepID=UPI0023E2F53A|nr:MULTISPECIES: hypothetical protein [unclassified Sulfitobacter]MDF3355270.1 hypothetical protein [Sulfitobacter sp. KE27]MDF3358918.1 hypothetical protein [Sulfitobacter sp. KE33]MDF3366342.1 hypothetical protein [Sulfitobacter sp. Ks34]MDF3369951.1 hypothetical protein [Sulfitobacter sp. Ks43]MDF3377237.1 hypothetical protein [Sulfitobacter sp. KE37]
MPLKLGVTDEPSFCVGGGLKADAAFIDGVIWLHERTFLEREWNIQAEWLLTHEILHAKIHVARMATQSWLGKRRLGILELAARDALWLTHSTPALAQLSALLVKYRETGLDDAEEALVRVLQLLDVNDEVPVTPMLLRARRLLNQPWGWSPLKMFRTVLWLPVCAWTVRFR